MVTLLLGLLAIEATAQIVFQNSTTNITNAPSGNAATSLTITKPAGTASGDFLLAQITFEKGADAGTNAQITPAGWTLVHRTNVINPVTGTDLGQAIFRKTAGSAEPASYSFPFFQAVKAAGAILRYTGVNLIHPSGPIVATSGNPGESNPLTALSVAALKNSVAVSSFGVKKTTTLTIPTGTLSRAFIQNTQDVTIRSVDESRTVDGATGNRTSTAGSVDKWAANMVVIRGNTIPVYTAAANQSANEGENKAFSLGSFVDADAHTTWQITVNWGDGSLNDVFDVSTAGSIGTRNHTYADNGAYTVTVTVGDGFDTHSGSFTANVSNVNPVVTAAADQSADEGEDKSFNLGSFSDAGAGDGPWDVEVDWGDGSPVTTFSLGSQGSLGSQNHTYADNGTYEVTVEVTDKDDGAGTATFDVTVANVAPTVTAASDQNADEGTDTAFDLGSFSDPGVADGDWDVVVDWGDGSADATFSTSSQGSLGSQNHTYADNGTYTVTVQVTDKDNESGQATFEVEVANVAPIVTAAADQSSDEGEDKAFDLGSFSDPGLTDTPWDVEVDWGDGSSTTTFQLADQGSVGSQNHTYADNGSFTVTVYVTDGDNETGQASFEVTVTNVAPIVTAADDQSSDEGQEVAFDLGSFSDAGADDAPWTVDIDWGDSSSDNFDTSSQGGLGTANHTYADNGTYVVTVRVTDKDNDFDEESFEVTVSNLAPEVTAAADQGASSGVEKSFDLGSFSDAGVNDDPWSVEVDWGDGDSDMFDVSTQGSLGSRNHTYVDVGTYTVTVKVTDKDTDYGEASFDVEVSNVAPDVTAADDQSSDEGEDKAFDLGSFSDTGVNDFPWDVEVDWGDGSTPTTFSTNTQGALGSQNHTFVDNGTFTVVVKVTDKNGDSGQAPFDVEVANVAPDVSADDQSSDEGEDKAFDVGSFSDPGINDGPWEVTIDWGDGSNETFNAATQGALANRNHTYADNGTYTVVVDVVDKDTEAGQATFDVVVANVAPIVTVAVNQSAFAGVETAFDIGSFIDPNPDDDPFDVVIDWGDGSSDTAFPLDTTGTLGVHNHTYATAAVYTVTVTVTDKDAGTSDPATFDVTVTPSTHSISGTIRNGSNNPIAGVTVTASDGYSAVTSTDASGFYQFTGIPGGTDLTVTPTKAGHTFTPPSRTYTNLSTSQTDQDFVGASQPTFATVEIDAVGTATCHCVYTELEHTVSGDMRLLVVGISLEKGDASRRVTGVKYGSADLARLAEVVSSSGEPRVDVWYLNNPPAGTAKVAVSLNEKNKILVGAVSFTGVDQATPISGTTSAASASGAPNLTIPSSSGAVLMDVVAFLRPTMTPNAGQVALWNTGMHDSGKRGGASTRPGGAPSVAMGWTSDNKSDKWAAVGFSVNPGLLSKGSALDALASELEVVPKEFALHANYPNPFNPSTTIRFTVEEPAHTTLRIYNVSGQLVATLYDDMAESEKYYDVVFNASNLASGLYFYRLQSANRADVRKMQLVK